MIEQFVGKSEALMNVLGTIRRLQNFPSVNVLITGESGTGKELVARAIHHGTPGSEGRTRGPFVPVHCVAIPAAAADVLIIGHAPDRKGLIELADGGTLFLDEIGGMPASVQMKLLRALEDGQIAPVGASHKLSVRVLATTNADLPGQMAAGTFRRDLYFRLAQFALHLPPLRDRRADIPILAGHFMKSFAPEMGQKAAYLTSEAADLLQAHPFPGNVRELKNIIERALIETGGGAIEPRHLQLPGSRPGAPAKVVSAASAAMTESDLPLNIEKAEAMLIERALAQTGGNVARAARLLGINRSRIYRKFNAQK